MLSILIPIYNHQVVKLVEELKSQCLKCKIAFEIICLDDGSKESIKVLNRSINGLLGVNYVELSDNYGRSKTRNKLTKLARYEHGLYIDADSKIISKKYIKKYIIAISEHPSNIICGGRIYSKNKPKTKDKILHWKYGSQREAAPASIRNKKSIELFHSNNFCVKVTAALVTPFDEEISKYGYEDLEWATRAKHKGLLIKHIDNPIVHGQLKKQNAFLDDIIDSLDNLAHLLKSNANLNTKLTRTYFKLKKSGLLSPTLKLLKLVNHQIIKQLKSENPKLIYLDLLKLHYFDKALQETTK